MEYLFVICGAFSALFSVLLLTRRNKGQEHLFLGMIFFLITVNCLFVFEFSKEATTYYKPLFSELNYAIPLLYGPLLWFYNKALTIDRYRLRSWDYVHFLPFVIFFLIILIPVFSTYELPTETQLGYPIIKLVTAPFYLFAVIRIIRDYHKKFLEEYSYEQEVNLLWMNWIVIGAVILWVIASVSYIYNLFNENDRILLYDYYTLGFLGLYIFGLAFVAVRKTDLFSSERQVLKVSEESLAQQPKTEVTEGIKNQEDEQNDKKILLSVMEEKEPYLDPLLTLNKLSVISSIPTYRLTKVLKQSLDSSFYDFVNGYRVEKVKRMLAEGKADNYSILGIAEESGFNSKASFNRIFKKIAGQTPTSYLKAIKGQSNSE